MNEQRNEAVWYFVMSVLIAWICLKSFDFLGIAGHLFYNKQHDRLVGIERVSDVTDGEEGESENENISF